MEDVSPFRREQPRPVSELIEELILARGLRPGDKLPTEPEFATELGVGRNAVREAVRWLAGLGVIEVRHGYGMYLPDVSLATLSDGVSFWSRLAAPAGQDPQRAIVEVRSILETSLAGQVVRLVGPAEINLMREALAEMEGRAAVGEHAPEADGRFHEALYRPLDNWILIGLLRAFWDSFQELHSPAARDATPDQIVRYHRDILEAVERRDGQAAAEAMQRHFDPLRPLGETE